MIIKVKTSNKRKDSHSRQHNSHLRSHSKSTEKNKQRSDSKLLLKLKQQDPTPSSEQHTKNNPTYQVLNRLNLKKTNSNKHIGNDSEYYNHFQTKSKSKGKHHPSEEDPHKLKYINSIYMHKESNDTISISNLEQSSKVIEIDRIHKNQVEKEELIINTNPALLNKIKFIERNCGIDANGKFVTKEITKFNNNHQNSRNMDSQNTISMFEGEKKKERLKKRDKNKKDMTKVGKNKKAEEKYTQVGKIITVKSAEKIMKKKQIKDFHSPTILDHKIDSQLTSNFQTTKGNFFPKNRENTKISGPSVSGSSSKAKLLEQTRTSPNQQIEQIQKPMNMINIEAIINQIQEENNQILNPSKLKIIYGNQLILERTKCIFLIAKLCTNLSIRRQAHSLAIFYMDKYIMILDKGINSKQLKLIALTSLLLALKMQDGIMSRKLCHDYIKNIENLLQNRTDPKSKSIQKQKQIISAFSSKQNSGCVIKSKSQSAISQMILSKGDQSRKSRKQQIVHSKQMSIVLALQLDIMMKFNFKLINRSTTYWIDTLTLMWDSYIYQQMPKETELLFRCQKYKRNLSHCYQIIQKLQQQLDIYQFSKPQLVLSVMYLILRMRMEEQRDGQIDRTIYNKYAQSLCKSTNLIFYDNVGINKIFGDYLQDLDLNISNLINSIRYVGIHLNDEWKVFNFSLRGKPSNCRTYEHSISIYECNLALYRFSEEN